VAGARRNADRPVLELSDGRRLRPDRIWLGTGTEPRLDAFRALDRHLDDVPVLEGLPVLGDDLRLGPLPIHVSGRLATLALGPAAGNLWGAQRATERIAPRITGVEVPRPFPAR
jgi:hypothetical protein